MSWVEESQVLQSMISGLPTTVTNSVGVAIAGLPAASKSGSYADLTGVPTSFNPNVATASVLGGIKVGGGLTVMPDGTLSVTALGGVQSFGGRTGAITLTSADVTAALTYTPLNSTQKGAVSGLATLDGSGKLTAAQIPTIPASSINFGSTFATVATSGSYADLTNKPTLATVATTGSYSDLTNKPALATIATTGAFSDLSGKPTTYTPPVATSAVLGGIKIGTGLEVTADGTVSVPPGGYSLPAATTTTLGGVKVGSGLTVGADGTINATGSVSSVAGRTGAVTLTALDISGFAPVARSGVYGDLTGKPTSVSSFTNDMGYQTAAQVNAAVQAIVGSAPAALDTLQEIATQLAADESVASALTATVALKADKSYVDAQMATVVSTSTLAAVATSGSYNDLANKPTIPVAYNLSPATSTTLGGVKVGSGLSVAADGTITASGAVSSVAGRTGAVTLTAADVGLSNAVTGVTATAPVVSSGGTTPVISMAAANASVNGYLTSTDWNTFNGKQAALGFTPYNATNPSGYQTAAQVAAAVTAGAYSLPTATTGVLGGVKVDGTTITITNGVISSAAGGAATTTANISTWTGTPYDIIAATYGTNTASEVTFRMKSPRALTLPTNFTGSTAVAGTSATASAVYIIQKNGSQVATVTFGAGSTTGTFSTQSAISIAVGDQIKIVAPATADATLADIDFSILATMA